MLFVVLPLTLLLVAATVSSGPDDGSFPERVRTVAIFFSALGPLLGTALSLVHSFLEKLLVSNSRAGSIVLGPVLGIVAVLPLVLERERMIGVLYGVFAGGVYSMVVNLQPGTLKRLLKRAFEA